MYIYIIAFSSQPSVFQLKHWRCIFSQASRQASRPVAPAFCFCVFFSKLIQLSHTMLQLSLDLAEASARPLSTWATGESWWIMVNAASIGSVSPDGTEQFTNLGDFCRTVLAAALYPEVKDVTLKSERNVGKTEGSLSLLMTYSQHGSMFILFRRNIFDRSELFSKITPRTGLVLSCPPL